MARLPDDFIQQIRDHNEIESVISGYMELRRRGKTLTGLCPFHNEKTPSFTVYPETSSYYCFGCGAGGDVVTFIRNIENLDYIEAIKLLADRSGLKMPDAEYDDSASNLRRRVFEANRALKISVIAVKGSTNIAFIKSHEIKSQNPFASLLPNAR